MGPNQSQLAYYKWAGVINRLPGCGLTGYPLGFHRFVGMHQTLKCEHPSTNQGVLHVNSNGDMPDLLFGKKTLRRFPSVYYVFISLKLSNSFKRLSTLLIPMILDPHFIPRGEGIWTPYYLINI